MNEIELQFENHTEISLQEARFLTTLEDNPRVSGRGKGLHSFFYRNTFQWTSAVQAMSVLFIRTAIEPNYVMVGEAGSLASSLDYALSKKPLWLLDMFGLDLRGESIARKLFLRQNPERKRGKVVKITINTKFCFGPGAIEIFLGDEPLKKNSRLEEIAVGVERQFSQKARRVGAAEPLRKYEGYGRTACLSLEFP